MILVGLPGSGKSTVAPLVAASLGRPCFDIDSEIIRREGCSVPELFAARGEAGFRESETAVTRELMTGPPSVIAAGGGWVLTDANLKAAADAAVVVHLKVTPATAARRIGRDSIERPLLAEGDPRAALQKLEGDRRERYARSDVQVDTELLEAEEVASAVVLLIDRSV